MKKGIVTFIIVVLLGIAVYNRMKDKQEIDELRTEVAVLKAAREQ